MEKQLDSLQGKKLACAKMAPRKVEGCSGHVTGQRSLHGRGSRKGLQRAPTNTMLFSDYHLAKLNPNCHMNYSIIFTEISFSPETSNLCIKSACKMRLENLPISPTTGKLDQSQGLQTLGTCLYI